MKIYQVDAFTEDAFGGNPAAVCLLSEPRDDTWMQKVAMEMNLSETAFLASERNRYRLRWFTPAIEVPLCGHATLASAHILWEEGLADREDTTVFITKSGILSARQVSGYIEMEFPRFDVTPAEPPVSVINALGIEPVSVAQYEHHDEILYLFELQSEKEVRSVAPDFPLLRSEQDTIVVVTSRSDSEAYDFVSRFFAPAAGIDEDPVTGSAHCYLTPFWGRKLAKSELTAFQASKRGGSLRCTLTDANVLIRGKAITVFRGDLCV